MDRVRGRVAAANGVRELNTAVSSVIASIGMELVDGQLSATFRLHIPKGEEPGIAGGVQPDPVSEAQADRMRAYFDDPLDATTSGSPWCIAARRIAIHGRDHRAI